MDTGVGGGDGGYNSGHQAIIGIKPPGELLTYDLSLFDDITISSNPLFFTDAFTIHTNIANDGTNTFVGDFSIAIFDQDLNLVEFAEILEGISLEGGGTHYVDGVDFVNPGSLNMLPGTHYAVAVYRPAGGNWQYAGDGSYTNLLEIEVYYSSDIELYSDITISSGSEIQQEESFTVSADIANYGTATFTGAFEFVLFDMDGNFSAIVEILTGVSLPSLSYTGFEFTSAGLSIDPGTYLLALMHQPDEGNVTLSGSSFHTNPIKVIVKEAPLSEDMYENNDEELSAYELALNYSSNTASVSTPGSNAHIGTDLDFYSIDLESGYDYTINARIHDSYNSGNQEVYSLDMLWAFNAHGYWSEVYDDVMAGSIEVPNGGEVLFVVAPYFEGETGTYLLDIEVNRTEIVSAGNQFIDKITIYPNPTMDKIFIKSSKDVEYIKLYDLNGKLLLSTSNLNPDNSIDISACSEGVYFLHIVQRKQTTIHKIIKQ